MHSIRVLEEILLGVAVEALLRGDLAQLVVDLMARWGVAQNLVAEGDGVVEIATLGVKIDRLLVIIDGLIGLVQAEVKVTDAIVNGDVLLLVGLSLGVPDDL